MGNKEKLVQIYENMADITLTMLKRAKEAETIPNNEQLQMVSATLLLYNAMFEQ